MTIRLYWSGGHRQQVNFGDDLSPLLIRHLSGRAVVYADPTQCDLAAIGSILDKLVQKQWKRLLKLRFDKVRVWGSGSFAPDLIKTHRFFDIRAVRGPLTRDAMGLSADLPLGDPGLLADRFVTHTTKQHRWGIIPHVEDRALPVITDLAQAAPHSCVIDLGNPDLVATINAIAACDFIISSSLHGIIVADALGIPNLWMQVSDNVFGANWKFADYFASVVRPIAGPVAAPADLRAMESMATVADAAVVAQRRTELEHAFHTLGL